jgi:hypothetical protein
MTFHDFIDALYKAGWRAPCDAQWENAGTLWDDICRLQGQLDPSVNNDWCPSCGCGNNTARYAHLEGCSSVTSMDLPISES